MKQYDANHDGKIDFAEFESYVERRQKDMAKAFDQLDADTNGRHLGAIDTNTLVRTIFVDAPILGFSPFYCSGSQAGLPDPRFPCHCGNQK